MSELYIINACIRVYYFFFVFGKQILLFWEFFTQALAGGISLKFETEIFCTSFSWWILTEVFCVSAIIVCS